MNRIQNNILQPFRFVNAREKQYHRSRACYDKYMSYPVIMMQGNLLNHQFRLPSGISIASINVFDSYDLAVTASIPTSIYSTKTHGEITYFKCKNASISLPKGQYYLELVTSGGFNLYSELFSVVDKPCCYHQLIWSNDCNTKYEDFEDGFSFNLFLRSNLDVEPDSVLVQNFTEQEGQIFKEDSQVQDWFKLEVGPVASYMQRVFNSIAAHDNIVFVDKNGEISNVSQLQLESFSDVSASNKCIYQANLRFRQGDAFFENGCCDGILETLSEQGLPIPDFAGCEGQLSCIAPNNLSVIAGTSNGIVKWSHSPNANSYEIRINDGEFQDIGFVTQYFIPPNTLDLCSDQIISIRSVCDDSNKSTPTSIAFETLGIPCGGTTPEENFFVVANGDDAINVQFDGSAAATNYTIQWKKDGDLWSNASETTITGEEYDITGLSQGTKYIVRFRPNCPNNDCHPYGIWTQSQATTEACLLDMNVTVELGDCDDNEATVLVEVFNQVGEHEIIIKQGETVIESSALTEATFVLVSGIYQIYLSDEECTLEPFEIDIQDTCECIAPKAFEPIGGKGNDITLYWQSMANAESYTLYWKKTTDADFATVENVAVSSYILQDLEACTTYEFKVKTVCTDNEESDFSNTVYFATNGCDEIENVGECDKPKNLTVGAISETSSTIDWKEVAGAISYNVRWKKTTDSTWTVSNEIEITALNLAALVSCTQYEFQVQAVCSESLTSGFTSSKVWTTLGCDPNDCEDEEIKANGEYVVTACNSNSIEINVLKNDLGMALLITKINGNAVSETDVVNITNGQVELIDADATVAGNFEITPNAGFGGSSLSFTYEIENDDGVATGTVTVPVNACCAMTATASNGDCVNGIFDLTITPNIQNGFTDDLEVFVKETVGGSFVSQGTFPYNAVVLEDVDGDGSTWSAIKVENSVNTYCSFTIENHQLPACPKATNDFVTIDCGETVTINVLGNDTEG